MTEQPPPSGSDRKGAAGYLDTATYGLPPDAAVEALGAFAQQWESGTGSWLSWEAAAEDVRGLLAALVRASPGDIALVSSVAVATATALSLVPDGGEVLIAHGDFASVVLPVLAAAQTRGIRVRRTRVADLPESVVADTRMVAVSHVQSATGERADLEAIAEAAGRHGAHVFVDATQSLGVIPFDVSAPRVGFVACAAYKWLCCPRGVAFFHVAPELRGVVMPLAPSWNGTRLPDESTYPEVLDLSETASRFDMALPWHSWFVARASLRELLAFPERARFERAMSVSAAIADGLALPPPSSAIVSVDVTDPARALAALEHAGVRASLRGGSIRLSPHYYNTLDDAELAVRVLRPHVARRP